MTYSYDRRASIDPTFDPGVARKEEALSIRREAEAKKLVDAIESLAPLVEKETGEDFAMRLKGSRSRDVEGSSKRFDDTLDEFFALGDQAAQAAKRLLKAYSGLGKGSSAGDKKEAEATLWTTQRAMNAWVRDRAPGWQRAKNSNYGDKFFSFRRANPELEQLEARLQEACAHVQGTWPGYTYGKQAASGGDCYDANGEYFMGRSIFPGKDASLRLVHGEVTGQGPMAGVNYGHCWVEDGNTVIDVSNGKTLKLPKAAYYALGQIDKNDNIHVYTPQQFRQKVVQYEHWGPWDLKTSTGL